MENGNNKTVWWQTVPAILTAITGLIGAVTAFYVALTGGNDTDLKQSNKASEDVTTLQIAGKWYAPKFTSDREGIIYLEDAGGGNFRGHYNVKDDARIVRGHLSEKRLSALWVENSSKQECKSKIENSYHWGKIELVFNDNFDTFKGFWSYCDGTPVNEFDGAKQ